VALHLYLFVSFLSWPLALWLAWRGERAYRSLPELRSPVDGSALPRLSIIVPARNEAKVLPGLLSSLLSQEYPGVLEVIVADDSSGDTTAQVAASMGAKVVTVNGLPEGWLGKPYACQRGAETASGDWLLFTDADTLHHTTSASSAVRFALENELDGLSALLKQDSADWIEGTVLACGFAGLYAGLGQVRGIFNGQYILVRRHVFDASGGFEAVRMSPLEDLAFGDRLFRLGYRAQLLRADAQASVHTYSSPSHLWHRMTRLGSGSLAYSTPAALLTVIFTAQVVTPLIYLGLALAGRLHWVVVPAAWLLSAIMVLPWMRRIGPAWLALFAPPATLIIILAAMWGLLQRIVGSGTLWKGRRV
jgi:cellulose synthase/poly-beta-1,6-N-acetylglucosamine synthase-like glycosyltransferase